jgi:hypothetical protein
MSNDDMQWLPAIYAQFAGERFTLSDLHRKVCHATNPAMRPEVEAEYRETIDRLEGFIERSTGPRGGEGYCLTPRGFACGKRMHDRAAA